MKQRPNTKPARSLAIAALVAAAFAPAVQAQSYSNFIVFGDSLSDTGAFGGQVLNGQTLPSTARWTIDDADLYVNIIGRNYGITITPTNAANSKTGPGNNYAQGSARAQETPDNVSGISLEVRDLNTQVADYFKTTGGRADPHALYSVLIGGNDLPVALTAATVNGSAAGQASIIAAATSTLGSINALKNAGAKNIIVGNLPNFGATPAIMLSAIDAVINDPKAGVRANLAGSLSSLTSNQQILGLIGSIPGSVAGQVGGAISSTVSTQVAGGVAQSLAGTLGATNAAAFQKAFAANWAPDLQTALTSNLNKALPTGTSLQTAVGGVVTATVTALNSDAAGQQFTGKAVIDARAALNGSNATTVDAGLKAAQVSIVNSVNTTLTGLQTNVATTLQTQIATGLSASNVGGATTSAISSTVTAALSKTLGQLVASGAITTTTAQALSTAIQAQLPTIINQVAAGLPAALQTQVLPQVTAGLNAQLTAAFTAVSGATATLPAQLAVALSPTTVKTPSTGAENSVYVQVRDGANGLAGLFNDTLNRGINGAGGGIIAMDLNRLFNEVLAKPGSFGLTSTTGMACGIPFVTALTCKTSDPSFAQGGLNYLFADDRHPTPKMEIILSQYMLSVLNAPMFASQLVNSQPVAMGASQQALDERVVKARSVGTIDAFGLVGETTNKLDGTSENLQNKGKNTTVTIGGDAQLTDNVRAGVAFTYVDHRTSFDNDVGSFDSTDNLFSLFTRYDHGPLALGGDLSFGTTRLDSIRRNITLGESHRTEQGETTGRQSGIRFTAAYALSMGQFTVTPNASLAFREGKIDGYAEANAGDVDPSTGKATVRSTTMRYETQNIRSTLFGLGAKVDADFGKFKPFAGVTFYNESKDKDRIVGAGVVSLGSTFQTDVYTPDRNYAVLNLGARVEITKGLSGYLSYNYTAGLSDERRDTVALGLQAQF